MPIDLYEKHGISPSEKRAPIDLYQQMSQKNKPSYLKRAANDFANFTIGAGDALASLPAHVANLVMPESMQVKVPNNSSGLGYDVGHIAGDVASFIGGGELIDMARLGLGAKEIPYLSKLAESLSGNGLKGVARRGLGSAAYGGLENEDNRAAGATTMGGLSLATDAALHGAGKGLNKVFNFSAKQAENIKRNLAAAQGTKTNLGAILEKPFIKKLYENRLQEVPFSGVDEQMRDNAEGLIKEGEDILSSYLGNVSPGEASDKLGESLKKAHEEQTIRKNLLYNSAHDYADKIGFDVKAKEFFPLVKDYEKFIKSTVFLKHSPKQAKILEKLGIFEDPATKIPETIESKVLDQSGKPFISKSPPEKITLREADNLASELLAHYRGKIKSPDSEKRNEARIFGNLGRTLKKDISKELEDSENTYLKDLYNTATNNYKKTYLDFLDKDVYKFLNGGESPEKILETFIRTGKNSDKSHQLSKLMKVLDPKTQDLVRYGYLSRALKEKDVNVSEVNPNNLKTLFSEANIGPNQKKVLFPKESDRKRLFDYSQLVNMNQESLSRMFNPKTGYRTIPLLLGAGLYEYGHDKGGLPGGIAALGAGILGSRGLSKALTSEKFRNKAVDLLINNQGFSPGIKSKISQSLIDQLIEKNREKK